MKQQSKFNNGSTKLNAITYMIIPVLVGVIFSSLLIRFVIQGAIINGDSMWPTYENGQYTLIDKISWKVSNTHDIQRNDVIVCSSDYNNGELLIKRVMALPGETIKIDKYGKVYINNEIIDDAYGYYCNDINILAIDVERTVGEDEYFVCGDNRNDSLDSRFEAIGNIQRSNIIGRVIKQKVKSKVVEVN